MFSEGICSITDAVRWGSRCPGLSCGGGGGGCRSAGRAGTANSEPEARRTPQGLHNGAKCAVPLSSKRAVLSSNPPRTRQLCHAPSPCKRTALLWNTCRSSDRSSLISEPTDTDISLHMAASHSIIGIMCLYTHSTPHSVTSAIIFAASARFSEAAGIFATPCFPRNLRRKKGMEISSPIYDDHVPKYHQLSLTGIFPSRQSNNQTTASRLLAHLIALPPQ